MARVSYLLRRGAAYSARIKVPLDLVDTVGRRELVKALGTNDEREAKRRMWPVIEAWNSEFDDLRSRRTLTAGDKADAVWRHYSASLERDDHERATLPSQAKIDATFANGLKSAEGIADPMERLGALSDGIVLSQYSDFTAESRRIKLAELRKHLRTNEFALIRHEVEDYVKAHRLLIDPDSVEWADLSRQLMRAEIEALARTLERDAGDYSGAPKDPIVKPASGTTREVAAPGERIMELFETYARENPNQISADTLNQARRDIGIFLEHAGSGLPVKQLDKKAVREWKALLMRYPVKATETKAFTGMKIGQIVLENERVGKPTLTPRTVNRYLSSLGAFCDWLMTHGYIDQNPVAGMSLAKGPKNSPPPFKTPQLITLFNSPLFTGCLSADEWRNVAKPGDVMIRDHRYWVPLTMLLSGARPAEIAQLAVSDVREEHGHWIMHITEEGEGNKSVKTDGSMRVVPVHSELIRLGFITYRDQIAKAGHVQLFPDAKRNARGQMIADFSREFGRYLRRLGLKDGRGLCLYSFRHGATDALRRAGFMDEYFGFILGHTKATMTQRYGILPQGLLQQRVELIEAIAYPGLDLSHLVP